MLNVKYTLSYFWLIIEYNFNNKSKLCLQILTTLTTLLIECDLIRTQPGMIESVISVIMGIAAQVNEPEDRIVRQAVRCFELILFVSFNA